MPEHHSSEKNTPQADGDATTTIALKKSTRDLLDECKPPIRSNDGVIRRLVEFYREKTGKKVVE